MQNERIIRMEKLIPFYMPNNNTPSSIEGTLYHYTSAESLFKILEDMTLKPSRVQNLNDLNEGALYRFISDFVYDKAVVEDYVKQNCTLLCFSKNYEGFPGIIFRGTNHPAMWAHYANNSTGACIVIDEKRFIERNREYLQNIFYKLEDVSYDGHLLLNKDKIRIGGNCDIKKLVEEHYKSIFFHKHEDWKMEDERRLLMIGSEQKLHIDGCIKRISLGNKFVNDKYLMLKLVNYMISREYSCFKQIHPRSFTECVNDESGYEEMEVCHVLYNILNDIKNRSSAILDWENQEDFVIDPICFE